MRKLLLSILSILIIVTPTTSFAAKKILILGDSLSSGYKININKSWPNLLANRISSLKLDYEVVNSSISGNTTKNGLTRIKNELDRNLPSILILALGSNDGLRAQSPQYIKSNLIKMIDTAKEYGTKVLLVGFKMPGNYGAIYSYKFANVFTDLADEYNLNFVPFLLEGFALDEKNYFLEDKLHPNEKAQPIILENVWDKLKNML